MPAGKCVLELYVDDAWHAAAEVRVDDTTLGLGSPARVEYDFDYLDAMGGALGARDLRAVSCRYPIGYQVDAEPAWPAFLLDLVPSGAARRFWEAQLGLPNVARSDWAVLTAGGGNAPGNVRVADAALAIPADPPAHPGFTREDVLERADHFIEYAREQGASIAGGSGAAGDAPKFLLREDREHRWHADGALPDRRTARAWLVKFPRSPRAADRLVLEAEAPYYRLAKRLGARTAGPVTWERDCLFVPRFDRLVTKRRHVERLGLESLCSLAGISEFGAPVPKEQLAAAVARFTSDPKRELRELVLRDVLDVALGNTDNHARNTAVVKHLDGRIELSPLYDFAPMVLDPQGIARVSRWTAETAGYPDWSGVAEALVGAIGEAEVTAMKKWLRGLADAVRDLPGSMRVESVPASVIELLEARTARVADALAEVR
jgi:serine/threonine-protein kinase HipA